MKTSLHLGGTADAYLEWGIETRFAGLGDISPQAPGLQVGVLVEWKAGATPAGLPSQLKVPVAHRARAIASATIDSAPVGDPAASTFEDDGFRDFIAQNAASIELATPVANPWGSGAGAPASPAGASPAAGDPGAGADPAPDVVLACIDDSFPIANARFAADKRLLRLWDQGMVPAKARMAGWLAKGDPGAALDQLGFSYGAELVRPGNGAQVPPGHPFPAATDLASDHRYYMRSGLDRQRFRTSHGAHVLDALLGPASMHDRRTRQRGGGDVASTAPYVLVKLPDHAIDDPTGRWLGSHVLDALAFVEHATAGVARVVVNLSWGPQTGPRDGSSLLERAIDAMVAEWREKGRALHVVLPAGNSYRSRAHAAFPADEGADEITWCVPPSGRIPSFLECWFPEGAPAPSMRITPPDGAALDIDGEGIHRPGGQSAWGAVCVNRGGRFMVLLALAPTSSFADKPAPTPAHGRWKIKVHGTKGTKGGVEVHVSRADPNMGAIAYARQSYLWDPEYEVQRRLRNGKAEGRHVTSAGTLNGIATGRHTSVAAGYRLSDGKVSPYSSSGPTAGRQGPDWSYPADDSILRPGLRSSATRAGTSLRLSGTSIAAPQLARDIANGLGDPAPKTAIDPRTGKGRRP
jgi:hypothetical protein